MRSSRVWHGIAILGVCGALACAPAAKPLTGTLAPVQAVPRSAWTVGHQLVVFNWTYRDDDFSARGAGAARLAAPDSARLDLTLEGGFASGQAFVLGDSVIARVPLASRVVPPAALFWGAVGRLAVPPGDTLVRSQGDTLQADIVRAEHTFRAAYVAGVLVRLEHITSGKIVERMERGRDEVFRYRQLGARRALDLTIVRRSEVSPFDAAIWRH